MSKKFRIAAIKLFLTYSQVNPALTHQHLLEKLKGNASLFPFNYIIAKEQHQDGGTHYHAVLIRTKSRFDIKNPKALDIEYEGQQFHGNYQPVRNLSAVVNYVCKHKDYITDFNNIQDGELLSAKEFIIREVQNKGRDEALLEHYKDKPNQALAGISFSALQKQFQDIEQSQLRLQIDQLDPPFPIHNFDLDKVPNIRDWLLNPSKTAILVGPSGIGKTALAKAILSNLGLKTLVVSHKEDLRRLNPSYQAILVDDANIHELESTQLLALIDAQQSKTLRVLYKTVHKKAGLVQIITMNPKEFLSSYHEFTNPRIARRVVLQRVKQPIMININITNNNTNNFNFGPNTLPESKTFEQHQRNEQDHIKQVQLTARQILSDSGG